MVNMLRYTLVLAPLLVTALPQIAPRDDVPSYCVPPFKTDADQNYVYVDNTGMCEETGDCKNACVTFIRSTACSGTGYDDQQITKIQKGIYEQIAKDGFTESTIVDNWTFTFVGGTTAFPNQAVRAEFNAGTTVFKNDGNTFLPSNIYFTSVDDAGKHYIIQGTNVC
ncbi:hypothetical protein PFICI_14218 [Pestalotiopsis fici W106-1]|uniref:Uncharacterized protein n=1 Tax=Pestalotiopsis fici (strain W106-1 / CGMCC3.15140) TaxID=1229662 RepID=W3WMI1_PESFW|nr:uncharacterized protein PFICI_14218 [Pestalotiopsis fici W106-1]ETS74352.1 hypothetical protein PFICI_14218 [Pestalotiopsis fici W106-1]